MCTRVRCGAKGLLQGCRPHPQPEPQVQASYGGGGEEGARPNPALSSLTGVRPKLQPGCPARRPERPLPRPPPHVPTIRAARTCGLSRGRSSSWEAPPTVFHRSLTIFRQDWRGRRARRAAAERKGADVGAGSDEGRVLLAGFPPRCPAPGRPGPAGVRVRVCVCVCLPACLPAYARVCAGDSGSGSARAAGRQPPARRSRCAPSPLPPPAPPPARSSPSSLFPPPSSRLPPPSSLLPSSFSISVSFLSRTLFAFYCSPGLPLTHTHTLRTAINSTSPKPNKEEADRPRPPGPARRAVNSRGQPGPSRLRRGPRARGAASSQTSSRAGPSPTHRARGARRRAGPVDARDGPSGVSEERRRAPPGPLRALGSP